MSKIIYFLILFFALLSCKSVVPEMLPAPSVGDTLYIATYNVRIDVNSDRGDRAWAVRLPSVVRIIQEQGFQIVGVQELINIKQEKELAALLPGYARFSRGRDDQAGDSGERLALFYRKDRFAALDSGFFFLSETPDVVSRGWDAALNRICQWVRFNDKISNQQFYVFNAHFDHVGVQARAGSAALIVERIKAIAGEMPVVCMGDFNASPAEVGVYKTMSTALSDSRQYALKKTIPTEGTYNAWDVSRTSFPESVRIDYVFTQGLEVQEYRTINVRWAEGSYPSDHFPVLMVGRIAQ